MTQIVSKSKNQEILEVLNSNKDFNNGKVIVACLEETSNEDYKRIMLVQNRSSSSNSVNDLKAKALGWDKRLERTWINIKTSVLEDLKVNSKLTVTQGLNADDLATALFGNLTETKIIVIHETEPRYDKQTPMTTSDGELLTHNNGPVYRNTDWDVVTAQDRLLEIDKVGSSEVVKEQTAVISA